MPTVKSKPQHPKAPAVTESVAEEPKQPAAESNPTAKGKELARRHGLAKQS